MAARQEKGDADFPVGTAEQAPGRHADRSGQPRV